MSESYKLGKEGEQIAVSFLKKKNYKILDLNFRFQKAEIDIVAEVKNTLVIVEVKTRTSDYTPIESSINDKKLKLITLAANEYLIRNKINLETRFDIIYIIKKINTTDIKHIKNAFVAF
ncbi:YraN family protein [Ichthyobacterium seriolicida]|uniref:UPF0102 protein JBKA6_1147 n=1 Tax=Ichthyobacterium seriolicida TaxID=242600 RepID=A0A1J1ECC2_9FLAO|nr:YraN family protein [Ichthyobacterium seriolicida]BAV95160.1 hypothetical protein JBKA6_1147 [Ichthyobacterium seriolicida]